MSSQSIDNRIPIVVGVTGHRTIREADRAALLDSVKAELAGLQARCPNSPIRLLTSLAEGGDQLCAEAAAALGIPLIAALPMPADEFERDFSPEALERFRAFCAKAEQVFTVPYTEAAAEGISRDFLYRQAGIYISAHSHLLLALWDGGPGTEAACGTAEAVDFSLHGSYSPVTGAPLRSGSNTAVIHVFTPRRERCDEPAGTVHMLGDMDALKDVLARRQIGQDQIAVPFPDGPPQRQTVDQAARRRSVGQRFARKPVAQQKHRACRSPDHWTAPFWSVPMMTSVTRDVRRVRCGLLDKDGITG